MQSLHEKSASLATAHAGARVLVVEDDNSARESLVALVAAEGYETKSVSDGLAALALARQWLPDLILTDLMMPEMCGHDLCRRVHELDPELPVIIMTALTDTEAASRCLSAGAADYLIKPLQLAALSFGIQRTLELRASKREREQLRVRTDELCRQIRDVNEQLLINSMRVQALADVERGQRAELDALLEGLAEGIIIVSDGGNVRLMNKAACAILGVGTHLQTVDALETLEARSTDGRPLLDEERPIRRALQGNDFADYEIAYLLPDGSQRRVVTTATNVKDATNAVVAAIIVLRDVTQLRRLEQQREEYTALISHDLRTPLSIISMSADVLAASQNTKQPDDDSKSVSRIARNARRMATMLAELTAVSQLESQSGEPQRSPCELGQLVGDIVAGLDDARARRVKIEARDAGPFPLLADPAQLERCVTNLLTNALKYSGAEAPVLVQLSRTASDVELCVVDRGIGISPESQRKIFERYYRTVVGRKRAEGLGLGLYIARLIAESHAGRIEVSSKVGDGSTFRLILPLERTAS